MLPAILTTQSPFASLPHAPPGRVVEVVELVEVLVALEDGRVLEGQVVVVVFGRVVDVLEVGVVVDDLLLDGVVEVTLDELWLGVVALVDVVVPPSGSVEATEVVVDVEVVDAVLELEDVLDVSVVVELDVSVVVELDVSVVAVLDVSVVVELDVSVVVVLDVSVVVDELVLEDVELDDEVSVVELEDVELLEVEETVLEDSVLLELLLEEVLDDDVLDDDVLDDDVVLDDVVVTDEVVADEVVEDEVVLDAVVDVVLVEVVLLDDVLVVVGGTAGQQLAVLWKSMPTVFPRKWPRRWFRPPRFRRPSRTHASSVSVLLWLKRTVPAWATSFSTPQSVPIRALLWTLTLPAPGTTSVAGPVLVRAMAFRVTRLQTTVVPGASTSSPRSSIRTAP